MAYGDNISGKVVSGIGIIFFSDNLVGVVKLKGYKGQNFRRYTWSGLKLPEKWYGDKEFWK